MHNHTSLHYIRANAQLFWPMPFCESTLPPTEAFPLLLSPPQLIFVWVSPKTLSASGRRPTSANADNVNYVSALDCRCAEISKLKTAVLTVSRISVRPNQRASLPVVNSNGPRIKFPYKTAESSVGSAECRDGLRRLLGWGYTTLWWSVQTKQTSFWLCMPEVLRPRAESCRS